MSWRPVYKNKYYLYLLAIIHKILYGSSIGNVYKYKRLQNIKRKYYYGTTCSQMNENMMKVSKHNNYNDYFYSFPVIIFLNN